MKDYPALDVHDAESDLLLAILDDFEPVAVEERDDVTRVFFPTSAQRDEAATAVAGRFTAHLVEVSDEDWARRSQENLAPVSVGRITVFPTSAQQRPNPNRDSAGPDSAIALVILPSMGFGTGHHATTRLCLAALQAVDLQGLTVLDVGTGSGVLAIAADRLGASRVLGIDHDEDAIQSARDNLPLNPGARHVVFETADLTHAALPDADVVTANLTGALLVRSAPVLIAAAKSGGLLILSGLLAHEREDVVAAFAPATVEWEREADGWIGLAMKKS